MSSDNNYSDGTIHRVLQKKETHKRESILGKEFEEAINYLNQFLPEDKRIRYIAWDMSRAAKR